MEREILKIQSIEGITLEQEPSGDIFSEKMSFLGDVGGAGCRVLLNAK